jgi:hypothetical protein
MRASCVVCLSMIAGLGSSGPACGQDGAARSFWAAAKPAPWAWRVTESTGGRGVTGVIGPVGVQQHQAPESRPPVIYYQPYQPLPVYRPWYTWTELQPGYASGFAGAVCGPSG